MLRMMMVMMRKVAIVRMMAVIMVKTVVVIVEVVTKIWMFCKVQSVGLSPNKQM